MKIPFFKQVSKKSITIVLICSLLLLNTNTLQNYSLKFISNSYANIQSPNIINPPPSSSPPGLLKPEPFNPGPQLENALATISAELTYIDIETNNTISTSIPLSGRTWSILKIPSNSEEEYISTIEPCTSVFKSLNDRRLDECDFLFTVKGTALSAGVGAAIGLALYGIAVVGPGSAIFAVGSAAISALSISTLGVVNSINAGALTLYSRYSNSPLWFRISSDLTLGFGEYLSCKLMTHAYSPDGCAITYRPHIPIVFSTRAVPSKLVGGSNTRLGYLMDSLLNFPFTNIELLVNIAKRKGFTKNIGKFSEEGFVFLNENSNSVLKLFKKFDGARNIQKSLIEIEILNSVQDLPNFPKLYNIIRYKDLTEGEKQLFRESYSDLLPDTIVGYEMEFIKGQTIKELIDSGGKIPQKYIDEALLSIQTLHARTGQRMGDHFGPGRTSGPIQSFETGAQVELDYHHGNTIIAPTGRIFFIDLGTLKGGNTWSESLKGMWAEIQHFLHVMSFLAEAN